MSLSQGAQPQSAGEGEQPPISWGSHVSVLLTGTGALINRHRLIDVSCRVDPASSLDSTASESAGEGAAKKGTKRGKRNTHQRLCIVRWLHGGASNKNQSTYTNQPSSLGTLAWPGVSWHPSLRPVQYSTRPDNSSCHLRPADCDERKETIHRLSLHLSLTSLSSPLQLLHPPTTPRKGRKK